MRLLPQSRFTLAVLGACVVACLFGAAAALMGGRTPVAAAAIGGPFALVDQDGRAVTQDDFRGHPLVVFFGYTHCPDVCPTTLADLTQLLAALPPGHEVGAAFITIDPERDTPQVLKEYLGSFDPHIRGLTGDPAAITAAERAYRVYARKVPTTGGDYTMDHTAVVYLMDKDGRFVNALDLAQPPAKAAADLVKAL